MHKHLTGALTAESRQEHRLKTALGVKSRGVAGQDAVSQSIPAQYISSATVTVGGQAQSMQVESQHDWTAGSPRGARSAGPGSLWANSHQAGVSELPVSHHASSPEAALPSTAAAASRLNAALTAAINTSPSKSKQGRPYSEQAWPHHESVGHQDSMTGQQPARGQHDISQPPVTGSTQQPHQHYPVIPAHHTAAQAPGAAVGGFGSQAARPEAPSRHAVGNTVQRGQSSRGNPQPESRADGKGSATAAAVQLAAGVSLTAQTTTIEHAVTKTKKSSKLFGKGSSKQQHEQQTSPETARQKSTTTTFGMRLGGSMMAAFNGWLVNEAVHAATTAATAAFSPAPAADEQTPSPATKRQGSRRSGRGGEDAGVTVTPSRWSLSGLLARSTSIEQHRQQVNAGVATEAAAVPPSCSNSSSSDEDYAPSDQSVGMMRTSSNSTDDSSSSGSVDPISREEVAEAAAIAAATIADKRQGAAGLLTAVFGHPSRRGTVAQQPGVSQKVKAVKKALLWQHKSVSWRVLGCGLYLILLIGYIPKALEYMQVTTLLPGTALAYLAYNLMKPWAIRGYCHLSGKSADRMAARLTSFELAVTEQLVHLSSKAAAELGGWTLAVLVLAHQALRGQRFTTSAWTVLSLWLLLLISELRVLDQTLLAMVAYAGLFSVPWLYNKFKRSIDALVCEAVHFLTLLLVHAERWAYGLALLAAGLVWQLLDSEGGSLVVQGSAAGLAAVAVLVWRVAVADV